MFDGNRVIPMTAGSFLALGGRVIITRCCNFPGNYGTIYNMDTIGGRLRYLRNEHRLTQRQVAEILKIDRSNYSKYEIGKLEVNNEMLIALAKFFDVTTDYLLGLEE